MPFLSFSTYHAEENDEPKDTSTSGSSVKFDPRKELFEAYKGKTIHGSSTLDEYYYHFADDSASIEDRNGRNASQVVTRYLHSRGVKGSDSWRLLRVNQLWAWAIEDSKSPDILHVRDIAPRLLTI